MKKTLWGILASVPILAAATLLAACAGMGSAPDRERQDMYRQSTQFENAEFVNKTPVNMELREGMFSTAVKFFLSNGRKPATQLPTIPISSADFGAQPNPLQVTWLGHSSTILEIDGVRLLIDPVFDNASPVPCTVNRFQPSPIRREELPELDAVVISHDHYDHLEMKTIKSLIPRGVRFIVPLGVGAHLEKWGCPPAQIAELDWWQSYWVDNVEVVATPSRHFSGRGLRDRFKTLWASFVFKGPNHSAFYSGDGGYDDRFEEIGKELGPFDLSLMECGAYDKGWPDVHMFPEEAVLAHMKLGAKYMLPVHWGTYDLAFHQWDAPIRQVAQIATANKVRLLTPIMGEACIPGETVSHAWWEQAEGVKLAEK